MTQAAALAYDGTPRKAAGLAGAVAACFRWLTIVVMSLLVGHILLDLVTRIRLGRRGVRYQSTVWVERFNLHSRAQHLLLMLSVASLFLSAVFLFGTRYPGAGWAAALSGALGGVGFWRHVHRLGGTVLIVTAVYHLMYSLLHEDGRRDFRLMLPVLADVKHLGQNLAYFAGRRSEPPRFGRFTYFEKFDYWAVFWGCAIMIGTGLALWFNDLVVLVIPGLSQQTFEAFKEAHAHEAVLAVLAIVIWHMYNIHVRPGRFPLNWLWVHGHMRREEIEREHPGDASVPGVSV